MSKSRKFASFALAAWAVLVLLGFLLQAVSQSEPSPVELQRTSLEQELLLLRDEVDSMRARLDLRSLFAAERIGGFTPLPARLTPLPDLSPGRRSALLDVGRTDGARPGQAVICEVGLVGRVAEASAHSCRIALADDPGFWVRFAALREERFEGEGIARGGPRPGELHCRFRRDPVELEIQDRIVTAGGDGVFPRGIIVGRVATGGDGGRARITPPVDYLTLRDVLVLMPPGLDRDDGQSEDRGR